MFSLGLGVREVSDSEVVLTDRWKQVVPPELTLLFPPLDALELLVFWLDAFCPLPEVL